MEFVHTVDLLSRAFELVGIIIIIVGAVYAFGRFIAAIIGREPAEKRYQTCRKDLGRAILLGLEVLVGADIIRTVAVDPSFVSVGVLGLLVVVRTFLSWSLEVEINGEWPWHRAASASVSASASAPRRALDELEADVEASERTDDRSDIPLGR